jgi:23S rRNA (uracil1939-C5)-methyltransferase
VPRASEVAVSGRTGQPKLEVMARRPKFKPKSPPFVGDCVTLRAGAIVAGGACLARLEDGRVVLLSFAAPGELVEAVVDRVHADYVEASAARILEASTDRVKPRCGLFGRCGGCQLQHLSYEAQLAAKEDVVREQLRRLAGLDPAAVRPIVPAARPWGYRNQVRLSTGHTFGDVGFIHRRGRGLLRVDHCPIASDAVNRLVPALQGHAAGLHQVQVRHSEETGTTLITPRVPGIDVESGQSSYVEEIAGKRFQVSASAFFQVNHEQAEAMVNLVGEALPERGELLIDAFAGVGTFAVIFADRFERVLAIEESRIAINDALVNVAQAPNVEVCEGKVEEVLPRAERADVVILDPPRPGCAPAVLEAIGAFRPPVVVYVSCNPATLARDLRALTAAKYALDYVTPIDMFPQTGHIECVAKLSLRDGA